MSYMQLNEGQRYQIEALPEMPQRTLQDTLKALSDLDIVIESRDGTKSASYKVQSWGAIDKKWIENNLQHVKGVLNYP